MTVRLIPERTVDSLVAIEIATFLPNALIWSPSNTRGQLDHEIFAGSRVLSLECKGIVSNPARDPTRPWAAPINYQQLSGYSSGVVPILYVLPAMPDRLDQPWIRYCTDPNAKGWCSACSNSRNAAPRRWAGQDPWVRAAPVHLRFQPWFAHWCWVIPAADFQAHLHSKANPGVQSCIDHDLSTVPRAIRLCHFLAGIGSGKLDVDEISLPSGLLAESLSDIPSSWDVLADGDDADVTALAFLYLPGVGGIPER